MTTKIGRNDLCPCGSGRKYKKCCLHRYDRHGYHELECYLGDIKDLDSCDELFAKRDRSIKLFERGTGRTVYAINLDWCELARVRRIRDALLGAPALHEEVKRPDGTLYIRLWGRIPTWNDSTIVMDCAHTVRCTELMRIVPNKVEGGESNGAT